MNVHNTLEGLSLAGLSSIVYCERVSPGAYDSVWRLKGVPLGYAPALLTLRRLAKDKHSRLLETFANYVRNKFYNTRSWNSIYKTSFLGYGCLNRIARIRHRCRKIAVLSCHRCLINIGFKK